MTLDRFYVLFSLAFFIFLFIYFFTHNILITYYCDRKITGYYVLNTLDSYGNIGSKLAEQLCYCVSYKLDGPFSVGK